MTPGAQSALKIDCTTASGQKVDGIAAADAPDGYWHRGTARTVAVTVAVGTGITFATGLITAADIGRPIGGGTIKGGAFIETVPSATSATLSTGQATGGATTATIEYTKSRVIQNAACTTAASNNLTTPAAPLSGLFTAADINKSVSGGPFSAGAKITAVGSATTATVTPPATAACSVNDTVTIGVATYSGTTPVWNTDPMGVQITNSATNGAGFSCAVVSSHAVFTETAAAIAMGQNFSAAYAKLKLVANTTATTVTSATTTALTTPLATCPAGITATAGTLAIGQPGLNAPKNGSAMANLSAELNLNPSLVSTYDDCTKNTYEGIQIIGAWNNPGSYTTSAVVGAPVLVSTGQILYPTSVISFAAFVRPQRTGDSLQAGAHFEFVFPTLPTTLAVCLTTGLPSNATQLSFGINSTVLATAPFVPTGTGGNPSDPAVRTLGPQLGAQAGHYILKNGATTVVTGALPTCTIVAGTTATPPPITCGDG